MIFAQDEFNLFNIMNELNNKQFNLIVQELLSFNELPKLILVFLFKNYFLTNSFTGLILILIIILQKVQNFILNVEQIRYNLHNYYA